MSVEFSQLIRSLKTAIKAKGYTYKKLANKIGMSEAGLKRLLNANDCSLGRILKICGAISVTLEDLISIADKVEEETQSFTEAQRELFTRSLDHLKYYYKLRVERLDTERIRRQLGWNHSKCERILFDLDRANLIRLLPGNKIGGLGRQVVRWSRLGKAMLNLKYEFTQDLIRHFQSTSTSPEGRYHIYHFKMSEGLRRELFHDLDALIEKYVKRGTRESMALREADLGPLNIAFLMAPIHGFAVK
jgi:DNA-binding Xre family transcriptional regulator